MPGGRRKIMKLVEVKIFSRVESPCRGCEREWESKDEGRCVNCYPLLEFQEQIRRGIFNGVHSGVSPIHLFQWGVSPKGYRRISPCPPCR